jgi:hypothetical protein
MSILLSRATHISLSAFILARSEPFSSYPFPPPLRLFCVLPTSDLTILFLYGLFFLSVSPHFPTTKFVPSPFYPPRSMPVSNLLFMVILLSFSFLSPPWGSRSRVTKVRILHAFLFYSILHGQAFCEKFHHFSPSQFFLPLLVSFVCFSPSIEQPN